MPKKKKIAKKIFPKKKKISLIQVVCIFLLTLLVIVGISLYKHAFLTKPAFETPASEMKKIPSDVKKHLVQAEKKPSLFASLRVPILLYHYVEYVQDKKDTIRQSLDINPNIFESQVKTLVAAHYTFMTAKELGDVLDGKAKLPPNPILLTFDDGHWDFDTVVLPILEKYHVKATAYIISGFLNGSDFMSESELQDVIQSGIVDVGAHTVHHFALSGLPTPLATYEITQSKAQLEKEYHIHVVSFAYPDGSFDQQAINITKAAGYTTAVSTIPGIQQSQLNRYFLYRIRPGYRTGQELLDYLEQNTFKPY